MLWALHLFYAATLRLDTHHCPPRLKNASLYLWLSQSLKLRGEPILLACGLANETASRWRSLFVVSYHYHLWRFLVAGTANCKLLRITLHLGVTSISHCILTSQREVVCERKVLGKRGGIELRVESSWSLAATMSAPYLDTSSSRLHAGGLAPLGDTTFGRDLQFLKLTHGQCYACDL